MYNLQLLPIWTIFKTSFSHCSPSTMRPSNSLPPISPPFLPPISPRLLSHFFNSISDGAVIHISPVWFQAYLQLAAMYWLWFSLNIGKIRSVLLYINAVSKEDDPSSSAALCRAQATSCSFQKVYGVFLKGNATIFSNRILLTTAGGNNDIQWTWKSQLIIIYIVFPQLLFHPKCNLNSNKQTPTSIFWMSEPLLILRILIVQEHEEMEQCRTL